MEKGALWRRVVVAKYMTDSMDWISRSVNSPCGVSVWRGIMKRKDWFLSHVQFRSGDGSSIRFWRNSWAGASSLEMDFPEIFAFAMDKEGTVLSHRCGEVGRHSWNLKLRHPLNDWEMAPIYSLLFRIDQVSFNSEGEANHRV